jgi:hypothetical protein
VLAEQACCKLALQQQLDAVDVGVLQRSTGCSSASTMITSYKVKRTFERSLKLYV